MSVHPANSAYIPYIELEPPLPKIEDETISETNKAEKSAITEAAKSIVDNAIVVDSVPVLDLDNEEL